MTLDDIFRRCEPKGRCMVWKQSCSQSGYGRHGIEGAPSQYAHIAAWIAVNGPVPEGRILANTVCRNKRCCTPEHWQPVTRAEQNQIALANGAWKGGPRVVKIAQAARKRAKLDEAKVALLRSGQPLNLTQLAAEWGCSKSLLSKVAKGKGWQPLVPVQRPLPARPGRFEAITAPPLFSGLAIGDYLPSTSAVSRAYRANRSTRA